MYEWLLLTQLYSITWCSRWYHLNNLTKLQFLFSNYFISGGVQHWSGKFGNHTSVQCCIYEGWPLCVWCGVFGERNAPNFDNRETGLLDLKKLVLHTLYTWRVLHTLYTWRVVWTISPVSTFSEFLDLCSFFLYESGFLLYTS